jgi:hypothetical protein
MDRKSKRQERSVLSNFYVAGNRGGGLIIIGDELEAKNIVTRDNDGFGIYAAVGSNTVIDTVHSMNNSAPDLYEKIGGGDDRGRLSKLVREKLGISLEIAPDEFSEVRTAIDKSLPREANSTRIQNTKLFQRLRESVNLSGSIASITSLFLSVLMP